MLTTATQLFRCAAAPSNPGVQRVMNRLRFRRLEKREGTAGWEQRRCWGFSAVVQAELATEYTMHYMAACRRHYTAIFFVKGLLVSQ